VTPGARNAPKLCPAEPRRVRWIVSSGSPVAPYRRVISPESAPPTVRWTFRMGSSIRTGSFRSRALRASAMIS
jgi:hypothetical protein